MSGRRPLAARSARGSARAERSRPWWLLPVVGLLLVGFFFLRVWPKHRPPGGAANRAEGLGARDAFRMGLTLSREGHHLAALEYFASVSRQMPVSWTARQSYASTLYNCAQEVRTHLGRQDPSTRSSVERVAMVRASMNESKVADSIATTPQEHAVMAYQRGQTLHSFGLVTNALVEFRRAAALDSSSILIAAGLRQAERRLARGGPAE